MLRTLYLLLIRLLLGYIFVSSGLCKLTDGHFGQLIGPPHLIRDLTPYGLHDFAVFLAASQVMVGALVMSHRWSLLGLVALVPLNVGILAVTISQRWQVTPYIDGFFLLLNLLALLGEWPTLRFFLLPNAVPVPPQLPRQFPGWQRPAAAVGLAAVAAGAALAQQPQLTLLAALGSFGAAYVHACWSPALQAGGWVVRLLVVMALGAVCCVTLGDKLLTVGLDPLLLMAGTLLLVLGLLAGATFRFWRLRSVA
ncbi:hypothetical protein [Hymenobacter weizhouensis]|uniref:hypothetical protein n=1 Tax=Hymenobacter sp. YIM 151500-1 TaxID=2987689 RepID=UPI0022274B63|nr:hypothetical protein [Hymenobacter sp. YIM 151500-1]UYZ62460.1 hypothetical protein OIS53_15840 [Hymenobacter sp. YIM 151500-1]